MDLRTHEPKNEISLKVIDKKEKEEKKKKLFDKCR